MARTKGAFAKLTISHAFDVAARVGVDPFEILCRFAKGDWKGLGYETDVYVKEVGEGPEPKKYEMRTIITPEMRLTAAKEAAKYLYAQKREFEFSPQEMKIIEIYRERQASAQELPGNSQRLLGQPDDKPERDS